MCKAKDGPRVIAVEPQYSGAQAESLKETLKKDGIVVEVVIIDPLARALDPGYSMTNETKMRAVLEPLGEHGGAAQPVRGTAFSG